MLTHMAWLAIEPASAGLETTRIVVARTMLRDGDWIVPHQHGEVYLAKPPLGYWLIALGSMPFGDVTIVSARCVMSLCALLVAIAVAAFVRREVDDRTGLFAGVATLTCALFLSKGLSAEIEMPLALFTTVAVIALFESVWSETRRPTWVLLAGLALGAAALVKGPVALLVFALAAGSFAATARSTRRRALVHAGIALSVSVLVGGVWLVLLFARVDPALAFRTMFDETFQRVHSAGGTNREPFWFYGPALLAALAPLSLCLPAVAAWRSLTSSDAVDTADAREAKSVERRRGLFGLLVGWSFVTVALLSLSQGKETRYLIASLPGWAILTCWAWRKGRAPWLDSYRGFLLSLARVVLWVLPFAVLVVGWNMRRESWSFTCLAAGLLLAAAVALHFDFRSRTHAFSWLALCLGILGARVFWATTLMASRGESFPVEQMGAEISARVPAGEALVELGEYSSFVELHADRLIRVAWNGAEVEAQLARQPHARFVLARERNLPSELAANFSSVAAWTYGSSRFVLMRVEEPEPGISIGRARASSAANNGSVASGRSAFAP